MIRRALATGCLLSALAFVVIPTPEVRGSSWTSRLAWVGMVTWVLGMVWVAVQSFVLLRRFKDLERRRRSQSKDERP